MPKRMKILLVGEGNFSFSAGLIHDKTCDIVATSLDREQNYSDVQLSNMELIKNEGGKVYTDVDATCLEAKFTFEERKFDKIIFNFPHRPGKMKICENRKLLRNFFASASKFLSDLGEIHVALCRGQSGTPVDGVNRNWANTWQIVENAAYSNLVLKHVEPFDAERYSSYKCSGYRGLEKHFNIKGAFTFIFGSSQPFYFHRYIMCLFNPDISYVLKAKFLQVRDEIKKLVQHSPGHPISEAYVDLNTQIKKTFPDIVTLQDQDLLFCNVHCKNVLMCSNTSLCKVLQNPNTVIMYHLKHIVASKIFRDKSVLSITTLLPDLHLNKADWKHYLIIVSNCELKLVFGVVDILQTLYKIDQVNVSCITCPKIDQNLPLCNYLQTSKSMDDLNLVVANFNFTNNSGYRIFDDISFTIMKSKLSCSSSTKSWVCGIVNTFRLRSRTFTYVMVDVDRLASLKFHVWDNAVLYNEKSYFTVFNNGVKLYRPLSLYSPSHTHDVSFWVSEIFDQLLFLLCIRCFMFNVVSSVELIDDHVDRESLRRSLCYRFIYCGLDGPLCHEKARDIHINFTREALRTVFNLDLR